MKRIGLISILFGLANIFAYSQDSIVSIPDNAFLHALIDEGVDSNGDGLISYEEAEAIYLLPVSEEGITDLTGIEAFINLGTLECQRNQLTTLDVSNNTALTELYCMGNQLISLDVSNNTALVDLQCDRNQLTTLDISNNAALNLLSCEENQLATLDVSNNAALNFLSCEENQLATLDVSNNASLRELYCMGNQLTSLDVSSNTALRELYCMRNQLTSLDVSNNTRLGKLFCGGNQLTNLDISKNTDLTLLFCNDNQLTDLDVTNNTELIELVCNDNLLTSLDVTNNAKLCSYWGGPGLDCSNNLLTSLDVSNNIELGSLICSGNQLTSLDVSNNIAISILDLSDSPSLGQVCVWESFPEGIYEDVAIDTTGSPNINFTIECAVGIEQQEVDNISIYPNPIITFLTIETATSDLYNIKITSLNGKLVLSKEIQGSTYQIDLSSFQSGVYFMTIRSKDFVTTRKIVKL